MTLQLAIVPPPPDVQPLGEMPGHWCRWELVGRPVHALTYDGNADDPMVLLHWIESHEHGAGGELLEAIMGMTRAQGRMLHAFAAAPLVPWYEAHGWTARAHRTMPGSVVTYP